MGQLILRGSAPHLNLGRPLGKRELDYVGVNVPFKCNYDCLKCCNGGERPHSSGKLDLEDAERFILKCKKLGARVVTMMGEGEPTLDENFRELAQFINRNGLVPYIFTNGSRIDEEFALFLYRNNAVLIINLDFFEEEKYDEYVRKPGAFQRLTDNIRNIRMLYRDKLYSYRGFRVTFLAINLVLNNENGGQIPKIKEFCGDDVLFVVNRPMGAGNAARFWSKYDKTQDIRIDSDVSYPLGTLAEGGQCSYLRNGIAASPDGRILACPYAFETSGSYGGIDDDIIVSQRRVLESVDLFYKEHGRARCILRHPDYKKFVQFLKKDWKN